MILEEAKHYLKEDSDDADVNTFITGLITAATTYIYGQTGKTKYTKKDGTVIDIDQEELYNICLKMLIAHWYENRGPQIAGTYTRIDHSVDALVNHIALCGDYI